MNKYFLSIISILLLFQSFKVYDELFYHQASDEKSVIFASAEDEDSEAEGEKESEVKGENESAQEEVDLASLFKEVDISKGEKIAKQCSACHDFSIDLKVKVGPPLWGVVNRKSAAISDYKYSTSLINFKKDWSREALFYFLENPKNYIDGTKMIYKGLKKSSDRVNLISYLESLK